MSAAEGRDPADVELDRDPPPGSMPSDAGVQAERQPEDEGLDLPDDEGVAPGPGAAPDVAAGPDGLDGGA